MRRFPPIHLCSMPISCLYLLQLCLHLSHLAYSEPDFFSCCLIRFVVGFVVDAWSEIRIGVPQFHTLPCNWLPQNQIDPNQYWMTLLQNHIEFLHQALFDLNRNSIEQAKANFFNYVSHDYSTSLVDGVLFAAKVVSGCGSYFFWNFSFN